MRAFAITGIDTVFMMSRMMLMEAIRATPPSLRISEGTRSSAITAQAPAFSAILACSALVTSIMTPPLSISAKPTFTRHSFAELSALPLPFTFFASISFLLLFQISRRIFRRQNSACRVPLDADACRVLLCAQHFGRGLFLLTDHHKSSGAFSQQFAGAVPNFSNEE